MGGEKIAAITIPHLGSSLVDVGNPLMCPGHIRMD
jgi:hypothetical protein